VCFTHADAIGRDPGLLETAARLGAPVVIVASGDIRAAAVRIEVRRFDAISPSSVAAALEGALATGAPAVLAFLEK
jgi:hypothetical protein